MQTVHYNKGTSLVPRPHHFRLHKESILCATENDMGLGMRLAGTMNCHIVVAAEHDSNVVVYMWFRFVDYCKTSDGPLVSSQNKSCFNHSLCHLSCKLLCVGMVSWDGTTLIKTQQLKLLYKGWEFT